MEYMNDKLSIKNLLFTKAIANYIPPELTNGHKVYACTDCGDKFLLECSYEDHINRKSLKISYMCRYCGLMKIFYNRCNLLCHIRSHSFKTATINVTDLKIEPLPLSHLKMNLVISLDTPKNRANSAKTAIVNCSECKKDISTGTEPAFKVRANHFMQFTNEVYTCPVCLFALPTECGLQAHIRIHLKHPPFYCPECGIHLTSKSVHYPYNHDCEGFKMMRATARLQCPKSKCNLFHPNVFKDHMKQNHLKKVYKCPFCVVACFNETTMEKHLKAHHADMKKALLFYQCELCPGRLVLQNHINHHLRGHVNTNVFPCWTCGTICREVLALLKHHIKKHGKVTDTVNKLFLSIMNEIKPQLAKDRIYRVVKRCDLCLRSFIYKCKYNEIGVLPNVCPYKCSSSLQSNIVSEGPEIANSNQIICHMCKIEMSQNWDEIKTHYAKYHKQYRCLDAKIELKRVDVKKYIMQNKLKKNKHLVKTINKNAKLAKKRQETIKNIVIVDSSEPTPSTSNTENDDLSCTKCGQQCDSKESLESHMVSHRDPCMAYQCMECGQSFVVKPSFSTHLLLEHNIADPDDYINSKQCYNEHALSLYQSDDVNDEPLRDNQCSICRDQFKNSEDLEKHFRVHGMAFLMKNTSNKITTNTIFSE